MIIYPELAVAMPGLDELAAVLRRGGGVHGYLVSKWAELLLYVVVFTMLLLLVIRVLRIQGRLRAARCEMMAALYGVWLFRRRPLAFLRQELLLIWSNVKLVLWYSPVVLAGTGLFALMYPWIDSRHGYSPCRVGDEVAICLRPAGHVGATTVCDSVEAVDDAVRITARAEVPTLDACWLSVSGVRRGLHELAMPSGHDWLVLNVAAGDHPAIPFQGGGGLDVRIAYPPRTWAGLCPQWVPVFLVLACLVAVPLGRFVNVSL